MKTIASFTINHDLLDVGMYTSRVDGDVVTYDVRMKNQTQENTSRIAVCIPLSIFLQPLQEILNIQTALFM